MPETGATQSETVQIGSAQIHALNVRLGNDILLDEVHIEGGDIFVEPPVAEGDGVRIETGETLIRAVMSEPNLNRLLAAHVPADLPVRNPRLAVLSGKIRFTGQLARFFSMPISLEAIPRIENGVRVFLDWQDMKMGIGLPAAVVDVLEQQLNRTLDLTLLPIPVWLDEVRCEPGRVTVRGRLRVVWPPAPAPEPVPPFSARALDPHPPLQIGSAAGEGRPNAAEENEAKSPSEEPTGGQM